MDVLDYIAKGLHNKSPAGQAKTLKALAYFKSRQESNPAGIITKAEARAAQKDLHTFVRTFWRFIEPDLPFVDNWHIKELCDVLMAVSRGEITKLLINIPPASSKSIIVSVMWPAWEWASKPGLRCLTASYGQHLTIRDNLRVRDICKSDSYQAHYALRFTGDQNVKELFKTRQRGWRFATSIGGAATGEHPDRIIIDDPHTAEQANSEVEREKCIRWFKRTISTRGKARNVRIVVIMQRLHEEDLSGYLLQHGGWEHVMFPMRFESERADPRDHRKEEGDLLWPDVFPEKTVKEIEIDLDPIGTAGQFQQRPSPEGGALFKRVWFEIVEAAPVGGVSCRGWDTAATKTKSGDKAKKGADWTVGVKMRKYKDIYYVEDVRRGQWSPAEVDKEILMTAHFDGRGCRIREEQEPGAAGQAVIAARARLLAGFDYGPSPTTGDKQTRARPYRAQCEAENVKLVRGPWNESYLNELEAFPNGTHDDQVDGSSASFNEIATGVRPVRKRKVRWG
jgi:predicted phage terminase large subunit-like protein